MAKYKLLAVSWRRREKDADGEVYLRRYVKGDVIDLTAAEERSLTRESFQSRRPLVQKVEGPQPVSRSSSKS